MRPPAELDGVVVHVQARHMPQLQAVMFNVPGQAMWIGDPTVGTIRATFAKDYPRNARLELLVYFHRQPPRPGSAESSRAFLEANLSDDDAFSKVWVYDAQSDRVLLRYP